MLKNRVIYQSAHSIEPLNINSLIIIKGVSYVILVTNTKNSINFKNWKDRKF